MAAAGIGVQNRRSFWQGDDVEFPFELRVELFGYLNTLDMLEFSAVNKAHRHEIINHPLWAEMYFKR